MTSTKNVASAVGGRTARACDSCVRKRARWYCAADDAFLCQACDFSVHSANPLARRHERVRLKTVSFYKSSDEESLNFAPSWHRGFTKKPRTPRQHGKLSSTIHRTPKKHENEPARDPFHLVPEVGSDETTNSHEENDEHEHDLLYRVPIFDPFAAELCSPDDPSSVTFVLDAKNKGANTKGIDEKNASPSHNFLPSDVELAEFAADVERLLGKGLENECIGMKELGLIDNEEEEEERNQRCLGSGKVKVEEEGRTETCGEVKEKVAMEVDVGEDIKNGGELKENGTVGKKKKLLQLNYEAVIAAWASQRCPWTNGHKPELLEPADGCWPHCLGSCGRELHHHPSGIGCHASAMGDGGREARVSRYREKRRTRLFSKKIRYEVRKLNAEKRPRMKGRFVKRASLNCSTNISIAK